MLRITVVNNFEGHIGGCRCWPDVPYLPKRHVRKLPDVDVFKRFDNIEMKIFAVFDWRFSVFILWIVFIFKSMYNTHRFQIEINDCIARIVLFYNRRRRKTKYFYHLTTHPFVLPQRRDTFKIVVIYSVWLSVVLNEHRTVSTKSGMVLNI